MPTGLISHSRVFISLHLPPKDAEVRTDPQFLRSKCPSEKALMEDLLSDSKSAGLGILVREHDEPSATSSYHARVPMQRYRLGRRERGG